MKLQTVRLIVDSKGLDAGREFVLEEILQLRNVRREAELFTRRKDWNISQREAFISREGRKADAEINEYLEIMERYLRV